MTIPRRMAWPSTFRSVFGVPPPGPYRTAETLVPAGPSAPGQGWRDRAACQHADPRVFFSGEKTVAAAKAVCGGCPVREDCLTYALANDEPVGVWGGVTAEERQRRYG